MIGVGVIHIFYCQASDILLQNKKFQPRVNLTLVKKNFISRLLKKFRKLMSYDDEELVEEKSFKINDEEDGEPIEPVEELSDFDSDDDDPDNRYH